MKPMLTLAALVVFASGMLMAQNQQSPPEETAHQNQTVTVEGCLGGTPDHYTIVTRGGQTIEVQSKDPKLAKMVGHSVMATGVENAGVSTTTNETATSPNGSRNTGAEKMLTASQISDVASTCNESTTKAKPQ